MSSGRGNGRGQPLYVPSHQRNKRPRFHGAFTGGFSAGHFNTVGSEEGWKPRSNARSAQAMEDYMDEDDHDQWGGPSAVRKEFVTRVDDRKDGKLSASMLVQPPLGVGSRLLRVLGWRDGSTVYVPDDLEKNRSSVSENDAADIILSKKKLRKIQLQQVLVKLPTPKFDSAGLGYDVYRNAPEFEAHHRKQAETAKRRAQQAVAGGGNVYRLSNLFGEDERQTPSMAPDIDDSNVSQDILQDFVGTKSVGGFALREDEDDVYDDAGLSAGKGLVIDKNEYNTEIVDQMSDEESFEAPKSSKGISSILSSWANGESSKQSDVAVTSDGRAPLSGFCIGSNTNQDELRRFPGPELPSNYRLSRHVFTDSEFPSNFRQQAKLDKSVKEHEMKKVIIAPMASTSAFASLKTAMQERFTSPAAIETTNDKKVDIPMGLYQPDGVPPLDSQRSRDSCTALSGGKKEVSILVTHMDFEPHPLICKRLGFNAPNIGAPKKVPAVSRETAFETHLQSLVKVAKAEASKAPKDKDRILDEGDTSGGMASTQRPAMGMYKSIFESKSSDDSDDEESDKEERLIENLANSSAAPTTPHESAELTNANHLKGELPSEEERHARKKRKSRKKMEREAQLSSSSTDLDDTSTDEGEKRRRRKKHKRRRKEEKKQKKKRRKRKKKDDSD